MGKQSSGRLRAVRERAGRKPKSLRRLAEKSLMPAIKKMQDKMQRAIKYYKDVLLPKKQAISQEVTDLVQQALHASKGGNVAVAGSLLLKSEKRRAELKLLEGRIEYLEIYINRCSTLIDELLLEAKLAPRPKQK